MMELVIIYLVAVGLGFVWDILDPDAIKITMNSPTRGLVAVIGAYSVLLFALLYVGVALATAIAVTLGMLVVGLLFRD